MDAAHNFKKSALLFAIVLSIAAPASAQTLTLSLSTVTLPTGGSNYQSVTVSSSDGTTPLTFSVGAPTKSWLNASASGTTTPTTITLGLNSAPLVADSATVTLTDTTAGHTDTATITVNYVPGGNGTGPTGLTVSPSNQVTLSTTQANSTSSSVSISSGTSTSFTASVTSTGNCPSGWLTIGNGQNSGQTSLLGMQTPATLYIFANALTPFIANGTQCSGTITLTPASGSSNASINVTFNVGSTSTTQGTLTVSQNNIQFGYPSGTQSASVTVGSGNTAIASFYNATVTSTNGWLLLNGSTTGLFSQSVGTTINLSVNYSAAAALTTGSYAGTVTLHNANSAYPNDITTINVTLSVNGGGTTGTGTTVAPTSLSFMSEAGAVNQPPAQYILVSGTGTPTVTPISGSGFSVNPSGSNLVSVQPLSQPNPGSYSQTFAITTSSGTSQTITATLTVNNSTTPVLIANASGAGNIVCNFTVGSSGSSQCNTTLYLLASDNSTAITVSSVTPSQSWVTATCTGTTTPTLCAITIPNPSALPNGINSAALNVTATGAASISVPVAVLVNGSSTSSGPLTLSPTTISMSVAAGASTTQLLSVSASTVTPFNASANVGTNCGSTWLSVSQAGATIDTNQTLTVTLNAAGLSNGMVCSGSVQLVANGSLQTVPVTMTVGGSTGSTTFSITPSTLPGISYQVGGSAPNPVPLTVSSTPSGISFTASVSGSGSCSALSPSQTSGTTPVSFFINVNTSSLTTAGTSNCTLNLTAGSSTQTFPITLTVTAAASVTASPTSLTFTSSGGQAPASQSISVDGGSGLTFSATASSSGNWLSVTPASGTTPGTLTVTVNPSSLNPSTTPYTGTITVAGTGSATGSTTINVSLTVSAPLPSITSVTNAASFASGSIAPGQLITIFGTAIGPTPAAGLALNPDGTTVSTSIGGVQVFVNGVAAPMVYASATQVSAVVPYELAPFKSASVVLKYQGQSSNGVTIPVVTTQPGIFTLNSSGTGPGAIVNQNGSVNSASNPAHAGDVVVIYMTGEGQTVPPGVTGKVTTATLPAPQVTPAPALAVGVTIDGAPALLKYAGEAPGFVSGVMQVNVQIPANARAADLPLVVSVGGSPSQSGVTVSVR